jgi:hypothetical protein
LTLLAGGAGASRTAVLVRHQAVGIDEVSRSGCRLEGREPFTIGTVGVLAVEIEGQRFVEVFRVTRSAVIEEGRYEAGLEFLPILANALSLHEMMARFPEP